MALWNLQLINFSPQYVRLDLLVMSEEKGEGSQPEWGDPLGSQSADFQVLSSFQWKPTWNFKQGGK